MKLIHSYIVTPFSIFIPAGLLILMLAGLQNAFGQNDNQQAQDPHPDAELHERMLNLAAREYNRALEIGSTAETMQPPENRTSYYQEMLEILDDARQMIEIIEERPQLHQQIADLVNNYWALEHNAAVQIMTDVQVRQSMDHPDEVARIHLDHAIMIQPDSIISYETLAYHLLETGDTTEAVSTYEEGVSRLETPDFEHYDELIDLYFMEARYSDAAELARRASEDYPDDNAFLQYRVDAYLQLGERETAITLLRELINRVSGNSDYHHILGTQLYQLALEQPEVLRRNLTAKVEGESPAGDGVQQEQLVFAAIEELNRAAELDPYNPDVFYTLGIVYQNIAVEYIQMHENMDDVIRAINYDREARANLGNALEQLEKAAELNPVSADYWESLYRVYSRLGMTTEQEEAVERLRELY